MTASDRCDAGGVVVTGANGLVGSAVVARLRHESMPVVGVIRNAAAAAGCVVGPPLEAGGDWSPVLAGCRAVIHTAARVHVMRESATDSIGAFRAVNVEGTLNLARQAAAQGVRRFIFISSIKVNGEESSPGQRFRASDRRAPQDAYAISKAEAEAGLEALAAESGMEVVVIRPPLVYGPGVKANFLTMMQWLKRGIPLPFGAVEQNRRSMVGLDNLVDLIVTCLNHPGAANQVFLAGDGEDLSTADLLRRLAAAMGVSARLLPVPVWALRAGAKLTGREALLRRLCGNLEVDISKACVLLGWSPSISVDEGLRRAAEGVLE
ncbi:SDR family oxidoreductase [Azoarcus sp. KH32C]|uniref:UDP-glucose 4-epimerase family protein n=1 Tax=Azoarcus sp. KH32C TaxID=748247 RepID=UPI0002386DF5|nr:SDR family oxidoreductase [Azoarcus sp. KH32C]BAL26042.1 NAD-dependent epimerase/dehydratase [Azoarcus sp. KH32C]